MNTTPLIRLKTFVILILIGFSTPLIGQIDDSILKIGKRISLQSNVLEESREIWVYVPNSYNDSHFQQSDYPVLYMLDGDGFFQSLTGMTQILSEGINGTFAIPEMIIVAILNTDRMRDLTPTHSVKGLDGKEKGHLKGSGGGNNFLKFIKDELIPKIDSSYRTSAYRIFAGHSLGGLTVLNALYTMPDVFNSYIAIDPSVWWDSKVMVIRGNEYFRKTSLNGKVLFLGQANTLSPEDTAVNVHYESVKNFAAILESESRSALRWKYKYYENDHHGSVVPIAVYDGLRFIFNNYNANLSAISSPEELRQLYHDFSIEATCDFLPPERIISQLGNRAISQNKLDLARQYFQMHIALYTKSAFAYSDLGQWSMRISDKQKALECFEMSLRLDPGNVNAMNALQKLKKKIEKK